MLPLNKAVLYKTGVGYFERTGKIDLNKTKKVVLSFKKKLMNDVLASLSVSGDNALVTGVSYEGHDIDLERALEDCLIKVPEHDSFIILLKQTIGSSIEITLGSKTINGIVLGIQSFETGVEGTKEKLMEPYLVLADEKGDIENIKIADMTGPGATFRLSDDKMAGELNYFLETMYTSKKRDAKSMTVFLEPRPGGPSQSEVIISFLHEVPSWKASYRLLVFPGGETVIQGFGLIDNPTDEDWNDINLSLVAGLPISFIYDLYSPNFIKRPTVARREKYDITPTSYEEAMDSGLFDGAPAKQAFAAVTRGATGRVTAREDKPMLRLMESTKVAATGTEGGDFFQYEITVPITVKRNESSLVPILQSNITANRMSVYNEKVRQDNPMLTMELTNDTNLTLEEGPISVYEAGNYAGEAMLPFLKKDEKRRIGYAVDLGVLVTKKQEEEYLAFHQIKIINNVRGFRYRIKKAEYLIKNKSDEPKDVVIEHPKETDFKLFETEEPFEESKNFYRYKVTLAPKSEAEKATQKLIIKTRKVDVEYTDFTNVSKYDIEEWHKLKLINDDQKEFLTKIWEATTKLRDIKDKIQSLNIDKNNISNDQNRLRENIKVLKTSHSERQLRDKYVKKLEIQEEILEKMEKEIEKFNLEEKNLEYLILKLSGLDYSEAGSLNSVAWGFWLIGDAKTCVEYAQKSLDLDDQRGNTWDTLACGLYGLGKIKESYEAFQKAIKLKPKGEEEVTKEVWNKVKAAILEDICEIIKISFGTTK